MAFVANALQSDVDTSKRAANVPMTSSAGYATGGRGKRTANSGKGKKALDSSDRTIQWVNQREVSPRIPIGVNCDTSEELYQAILSGFSDWKASRSSDVDQKHLVEGIATKLNLFGADYQDGLLSQILLQADELRDTVLGLLIRISSTFCNGKSLAKVIQRSRLTNYPRSNWQGQTGRVPRTRKKYERVDGQGYFAYLLFKTSTRR